jgi:AraC-like DNA-binding protein
MDPLSQVFELLDLRAAAPSRLEAGGRWALSFSGDRHLKVGAVVAGDMWLVTREAGPEHLTAGDCYLVSCHFAAASDLETEPVPGSTVMPDEWPGTMYYQTTRDDPARTIVICGDLSFDDTASALLDRDLPPVSKIAADSPQAAVVASSLALLATETAVEAPGSAIMRSRLTEMMFVQVLRALLDAADTAGAGAGDPARLGWLGALGDQQIGKALTLIHQQPARKWTVAQLASAVSMSRTSFATRFRALVGLPPLDYLVRLRVQVAARALRSTDRTVAAIASDLGYASESAFSTTFKRIRGVAPSVYRQPRTAVPAGSSPAAT